MRVAIVGAGGVGGYFAAKLASSGEDVAVIARGAHLEAMRQHGLAVRSPALGDLTVRVTAESEPSAIGPVDLVLFAVKTYDTASALPLVDALLGPDTAVLTLQNGVDAADEVATAIGEERVLGGTTYVATSVAAPGVIAQTGTHRSIIFGEAFGACTAITPRVEAIAAVLGRADIQVRAVPDARVPIWDKFVYLAPFAGITGAARLPIGPLWARPDVREVFYAAAREVAAIAAAEGIAISADRFDTLRDYMDHIPATTKSSLLTDLEHGRRIEVRALHGAALRRAAAHGVAVPILSALHAVLAPWADGAAAFAQKSSAG